MNRKQLSLSLASFCCLWQDVHYSDYIGLIDTVLSIIRLITEQFVPKLDWLIRISDLWRFLCLFHVLCLFLLLSVALPSVLPVNKPLDLSLCHWQQAGAWKQSPPKTIFLFCLNLLCHKPCNLEVTNNIINILLGI